MSAEHSRNSEVAVTVNEMDGEKNDEKPELDAGERRKLGIVKFDGFDDIDDGVE
uniref:Uncharacterized protein n=1 Tax=Caenorhabditis japonica TaxID=281687 RepID=A0A8R1IMI6_CAEJA